MRPLVVVLVPKGVEVPLLRGAGAAHRFDRFAFERAVHAFVRAVLLRAPGPNALVNNPESHPPHVEIRQAVNRLRRERHAVVGADRERQPVLAKRALEDGACGHGLRREQAATREQEARVLIGDA